MLTNLAAPGVIGFHGHVVAGGQHVKENHLVVGTGARLSRRSTNFRIIIRKLVPRVRGENELYRI